MPHAYLDLHDRQAVYDFMSAMIEYLPAEERQPFDQIMAAYQGGKPVATADLAERAMKLAQATWVPRQALKRYVDHDGAETEWRVLLEQVRPATALLLKRLRKRGDVRTVDEALASSDAPFAIHDSQEMELALVRPALALKLWQEQQRQLAPHVAAAKKDFVAVSSRLERLRQQALAADRDQNFALAKIEQLEDRVYIGGEMMALEILDQELGYEIEDHELPPEG